MSIYIGNLSYAVSEQDLKTAFRKFGTVKQVKLPTDHGTGKNRGFAFVEMGNDGEEAKAIKTLEGSEWMGGTLKVNKAKPKVNRLGGDIFLTGNLF